MDANAAYNDDEVLDFLMEADLVDLHNDTLFDCPPTYNRSSKQIDIFAGSLEVLHYLLPTYILDPMTSEGDHHTFGGDLNLGALINCTNIRRTDTTSDQFRILTSTDIKAQTKYLKDLRSQLEEHNVTLRLQNLFCQCTMTNMCTEADERSFQQIASQLYSFAQ